MNAKDEMEVKHDVPGIVCHHPEANPDECRRWELLARWLNDNDVGTRWFGLLRYRLNDHRVEVHHPTAEFLVDEQLRFRNVLRDMGFNPEFVLYGSGMIDPMGPAARSYASPPSGA